MCANLIFNLVQSLIFDEVDLSDASVAETSTKNINNSFTFKAHKRCAVRSTSNCKWTTLASIGNDIIEDEEGVPMPHQWLEGNLPVHNSCKDQMGKVCPLGQCRVSIIPPTTLNSIDSDGFWKATSASCSSPLLVLVNSKSGDNQGVKFLRKFKQLLNPAQVFDLMNGGPQLGASISTYTYTSISTYTSIYTHLHH
ncbi:LOW QUALITY PROTEIN: hypothetical protein CRUP_016836 [Coryphaenoides rupestris]|nr:LOW QUALITY PROTEIN: hypothetical protein CRUP_016836 [Coryphaenoides rupestris]